MTKSLMKYAVVLALVAGAFYIGQKNPTLFKKPM